MVLEEDLKRMKEDIKAFNRFADYVEATDRSVAKTFEEMVEMPDEEFARHYLMLMETHRVTHGWWAEAGNPVCADCGEDIPSPRELRMYEDRPYHPTCFRKACEADDKEESELMKNYWEKVLGIDA